MTGKEEIIAVLNEQPEDASYDDLLRELAFARMVERGLADSAAGRIHSSADAQRKIDSWAK